MGVRKEYMDMAWNVARKLINLPDKDRENIFGYSDVIRIIKNFSVIKVESKIAKYENELREEEIEVGDVVTVDGGDIAFICTKDNSNGDYTKCHLVAGDGSVYEDCDKFDCQKTGKSIDIGEILKEIDR